MTPKQISNILIIILAIIAAITAVGFIAGYKMQPFVVAYWLVLTAKNLVDYVGTRCEK